MKKTFDRELIRKYLKEYDISEYFDEQLVNHMSIYEFEKGEFIYFEGQIKQTMYFFVEGMVKVTSYSQDGGDMLLGILRPFEVLGDIELIMEEKIYNNVECKKKCILVGISSQIIKKELENDLTLYKLFAKRLAQKLAFDSERLRRLLLYPVKKRVLYFIKDLKYDNEALNNLKYKEISKMIGISDRQLRRVLAEYEKEGVIKRERTGIVSIDEVKIDECLEETVE